MLRTSYKCVGRVERKIEDSEAKQRLVTFRSHPIPRAGGTMEEVLSPRRDDQLQLSMQLEPQMDREGGTYVSA